MAALLNAVCTRHCGDNRRSLFGKRPHWSMERHEPAEIPRQFIVRAKLTERLRSPESGWKTPRGRPSTSRIIRHPTAGG
jgi:hypothetical protein